MIKITEIIIYIIHLLILMTSCGERTVMRVLSDVESFIEARPDSALVVLREVDTTVLQTQSERAKYSLLYAMALDKNYIDTSDTRIIMPAVEYYERHGDAEEKLKAYMYLGTELYCSRSYSQAIVSFSRAEEQAPYNKDHNLLGVLYSKMADTYTMTRDYLQASNYINKSIDCFRLSKRRDQEKRELIRKALNLTQTKKWQEADSCYNALLTDSSLDISLINRAEIDYSMFLMSKSPSYDSLAYVHISNALNNGASFYDLSQFCAYAYLLNKNGKKADSEVIWNQIECNNYPYHYWRHRELLNSGDYKNAYKEIWLAMNILDSSINDIYEHSASNSQRIYMEIKNNNHTIQLQKQHLQITTLSLICAIIALIAMVICTLYLGFLRRHQNEQERIGIVIENMRNQILENERLFNKEATIKETLKKRAKFAFLGDVYEEVYRHSKEGDDINSLLLQELQSRIGDLRSDKEAQTQFEKMIDLEMNGLMTRFKGDCPGLSDSEYKMSSYLFAGFDNTTTMIIMGISTPENMRTMKKRLKKKIQEQCDKEDIKENYIQYFR